MKASPRKAANLSESIHQRLSMYALTASAAGVGALCLAHPAEAKIVYTPANVKIVLNGGLIGFDLNHDGIADFAFSNWSSVQSFGIAAELRVVPSRQANEIWGAYISSTGVQVLFAAPLPKGTKVGPKGQFQRDPSRGLPMAQSGVHGGYGSWQHVTQAYLGLKFVIKGETHFGWARVRVSASHAPFTATLTGYVYETIPGKAILAGATKEPDSAEPTAALSSHTPEPTTLGALALGAPGLSIWRRKESAAAALAAN